MILAKHVLDALDAAADAGDFPIFDNAYVFPAATRLSVYRSESRWELVVEQSNFNPTLDGAQAIGLDVSTIGPRGVAVRILTPATGPEGAFVDGVLGESVGDIIVRGVTIRVPADEMLRQYAFRKASSRHGATVLRALVAEHVEPFLATDAERRACVSADAELVLQLREWEHPDVSGGKRPSSSETFRAVATCLESGNFHSFRVARSNTDWRNWPDAGFGT